MLDPETRDQAVDDHQKSNGGRCAMGECPLSSADLPLQQRGSPSTAPANLSGVGTAVHNPSGHLKLGSIAVPTRWMVSRRDPDGFPAHAPHIDRHRRP
jgi:hypothetical protein